jgi:hypothetical protein
MPSHRSDREIERRRIGERQVRNRPEEHRDFERRQNDAQHLQARPRRVAKAERPACQMNGLRKSSVNELRISMNSPTGYFATSHLPAALLSANRNTATSMKPMPASAAERPVAAEGVDGRGVMAVPAGARG